MVKEQSLLSNKGPITSGKPFSLKLSAWVSRTLTGPASWLTMVNFVLTRSWLHGRPGVSLPLSGPAFPSVKKGVELNHPPISSAQAFSEFGLGIFLLREGFPLKLMSSN